MGAVIPRSDEGHRGQVRVAVAIVLALHGVAHFAGLVDSFAMAGAGGNAEYLGGLWTISDATALRVVGLLWGVVGFVVVLSAALVLVNRRRGRETVMLAVLLSLVLSVMGSWAAVVGVGVNVVLLTLVALAPERAGLR
jgi:hypothetical protein